MLVSPLALGFICNITLERAKFSCWFILSAASHMKKALLVCCNDLKYVSSIEERGGTRVCFTQRYFVPRHSPFIPWGSTFARKGSALWGNAQWTCAVTLLRGLIHINEQYTCSKIIVNQQWNIFCMYALVLQWARGAYKVGMTLQSVAITNANQPSVTSVLCLN